MKQFLLTATLLQIFTFAILAQNVGIGNPAPLHKLDVTGDINLTGSLRINGSVGSNGQVLMSNGTSVGWQTPASGTVDGVTASNGLNSSGGNTPDIKLGGNISQNTTINVGNNTFNLTGSMSRIAIGEGAQIETGGSRAVAIGSQARVNGTESVAIGIGNTGTSTTTRSGSYSLAMGQNITATGGANNSPVIAIGSGFTNNTPNSIMLGTGASVPSITMLGGSGSTPGNVGIGTTAPTDLLHLRGQQLNIRLENTTATTGRTYLMNSTNGGNFRLINANSSEVSLDIASTGNVGIGTLAIAGAKVNLGNDARAQRFEFDDTYALEPISGTWTSMDIRGTKGGYAGFYFRDEGRYLMIDATNQGIYTGSSWQWYFSNGTLAAGTVPWARLSGVPSTFTPSAHTHSAAEITSGTLPVIRGGTGTTSHNSDRVLTGNGTGAIQSSLQYSVAASNNTLVQRHSSGYIYSNYIHTTDNSIGSGVSGVVVKQGNDFHRTANKAAMQEFMGIKKASVVITLTSPGWNLITHNFNVSNLDFHGVVNNGDRNANDFDISTWKWANNNQVWVYVTGGSNGAAARFNVATY